MSSEELDKILFNPYAHDHLSELLTTKSLLSLSTFKFIEGSFAVEEADTERYLLSLLCREDTTLASKR